MTMKPALRRVFKSSSDTGKPRSQRFFTYW
nr:MAG TPA: hypothetical protein [Caudoviricetes sp.]